jgi:hypothetical protein
MSITASDRGCDLYCVVCGDMYSKYSSGFWEPPWSSAPSTPNWMPTPTTYSVYHYQHLPHPVVGGGCSGVAEFKWPDPAEPNHSTPGPVAGRLFCGDWSSKIELFATKQAPNIYAKMAAMAGIMAATPYENDPDYPPEGACKCECGSHKLGIGRGQVGHSHWCPWSG